GKIHSWGVAASTDEEALRALQLPGIDCIETGFDLCHAARQEPVIRQAANGGVAVIARQPFGSGSVFRAQQRPGGGSSAHSDGDPSRMGVVRGCLRFALENAGVSSLVVGMSRPEHVTQDLRAAMASPLNAEEIEELRSMICDESPGSGSGSHPNER